MVKMSVSIEKVLADARLLVTRLKSHDTLADSLVSQSTTLNKRLESMKEYEEDMNELNEIARHRPRANLILGLAQENSQIRELQQENRELRSSLEEHQSAIELIMKKYREQVAKLLMSNKLDRVMTSSAPAGDVNAGSNSAQVDKICEMAAVMKRAIQMDEDMSTRGQQKIVQLQMENKTLRELLQISSKATREPRTKTDEKHTQTTEEASSADIFVMSTETLRSNEPSQADIDKALQELDFIDEGNCDEEDESESEANDSVLSTSTIKRASVRCKTDSESSSRDADSLSGDLKEVAANFAFLDESEELESTEEGSGSCETTDGVKSVDGGIEDQTSEGSQCVSAT